MRQLFEEAVKILFETKRIKTMFFRLEKENKYIILFNKYLIKINIRKLKLLPTRNNFKSIYYIYLCIFADLAILY